MIFASGGLGAQADALAFMVILTIAFAVLVNFIAIIYTARSPASRVPTMLTVGAIVAVVISTLMTMMLSGGLTICIGIVLVVLTLPCFALCRTRYNRYQYNPGVRVEVINPNDLPVEATVQGQKYLFQPSSSGSNHSLGTSLIITFAIIFLTCLGCCGLSIPGIPLLDQILLGRAYSDIKESDVSIGMTKDELTARFGQPHGRNRDDDRWDYKKSQNVYVTIDFDKNGKVDKVREWVD